MCGDGSSAVSVLDTATNKVARSIDVGRSPHGDRLTPDGSLLLVAVNGDDQVDFVDTENQTVIAKTKVAKPHTIAVTPNGKLAYVASQAPGDFALVVVDVASHGVVRSIHLDKSPRDLEFGQDGRLYFTETDLDAVEVLDPKSDKIVAEIPTGRSPHIANLFPNALLGTVVVQGANELGLFDAKLAKVVRHVGVGKQPHWAAVSGDGKMAYVTNEGANDVSVVDIASGRAVQSIAVGNAPRKIAIR